MLKNKTILMVIVVAILVVTGFIGTRFVFKKFNVPSILPFSTTPQTSPYAGSSKSKAEIPRSENLNYSLHPRINNPTVFAKWE